DGRALPPCRDRRTLLRSHVLRLLRRRRPLRAPARAGVVHARAPGHQGHASRLRLRLDPRQRRAAAAHAQPLLGGAAASRRGPDRRAAARRSEKAPRHCALPRRVGRFAHVRVAVHTPDVVGERMAGPGIRAWHLADELSKHFPTTLVARREDGTRDDDAALRDADVLVGQPARGFTRLRRGQRMVYDLFDPVLLELREMYGRKPSMRQRIHLQAEQWRIKRAMAGGDLLMVAFAKQRELYRGARAPMIEVPFGAADDGPPATVDRQPLIVWGGGTWEWLDPRTAVDAVIAVNQAGVSCKLLFLGRSRPNRHMIDRPREDRLDQLLRQ